VRRAIQDRNQLEFGFCSGDEETPKCGARLKTETISNSGFVRGTKWLRSAEGDSRPKQFRIRVSFGGRSGSEGRKAIEDRNIFEFGFRSGDEVAPKCGGRLKTETFSNSGFVRGTK
jgi:hypothetical protein